MAGTSRRAVLSASATAALASIAGAAATLPSIAAAEAAQGAHPDAELIAIGREAASLIEQRKPLEARWWALPAEHCDPDSFHAAESDAVCAAMRPIDNRLDDLLGRALELPAATPEGMAAKAHLIRYEMRIHNSFRGDMDLSELDQHEQLVWALLHDLLGEAV